MIQTKHHPNKSKTFISFILIAVLLITGVFAILSATSKKSNVFTFGNVSIKLHESGWSDNNDGFFNRDDNKNKNIAPGQIIPKAPCIENDGNTDAWTYITVGIPVAESKDLYADADGHIKLSPNLSIKIQAYAIQQDCADNAIDTWSYYTNRKSPESKWGPEKTNNENMTEVFEIIGLDDTYWTQIGDVYHSQDNYNYYIYTIANDRLLSPNTTTNVLFTDVKLNSEVGILLSNRYHLTYLDGQTYKSGDSYSVGTNIPFDKFENVMIDGNTVPPDKYEKLKDKENLTVIKFIDKEFMSDWGITIHPISASANDGDATGEFEKIDIYCEHVYSNDQDTKCNICNADRDGLYDKDGNFIVDYEHSGLKIEKDYDSIYVTQPGTEGYDTTPSSPNIYSIPNHWYDTYGSAYTVLKNYPNASKLILPNYIKNENNEKVPLTHIGDFAFSWSGLEEIIMSDSINEFGIAAFQDNKKLLEMHIGANVYSENMSGICHGCPALTTLDVDLANPYYKTIDNVLYDKDMSTLFCVAGQVTKLDLPDTLKIIGDCSCGNTQITTINIPTSVYKIGDNAFIANKNLKSIYIPDSVTEIGIGILQESGIESVRFSKNITTLPTFTLYGCQNLKTIYLPKISMIDTYNFNGPGCNNKTSAAADRNTLNANKDISNCKIYFLGNSTEFNNISILNPLKGTMFTVKELLTQCQKSRYTNYGLSNFKIEYVNDYE